MGKLKKNRRERQFQIEMIKNGYEVLSKGWPDFLCYNNITRNIIAVEIKRKYEPTKKKGLSVHQKRTHEILRKAGLQVEVKYIQ